MLVCIRCNLLESGQDNGQETIFCGFARTRRKGLFQRLHSAPFRVRHLVRNEKSVGWTGLVVKWLLLQELYSYFDRNILVTVLRLYILQTVYVTTHIILDKSYFTSWLYKLYSTGHTLQVLLYKSYFTSLNKSPILKTLMNHLHIKLILNYT